MKIGLILAKKKTEKGNLVSFNKSFLPTRGGQNYPNAMTQASFDFFFQRHRTHH
jgi:hypothetical protein